MEIRLHGRGGQGGVTCAKILAAIYARLGKSVQTFGDYAGERSGAPIRAYTRVSDTPVTNRNKVYEPDQVLVLDQTLLGADAVAGLVEHGLLLVDSEAGPEELAAKYGRFRVATVDAKGIARRHGIGSRSVVIVNTTIAGAFVRLMELPFETLVLAYEDLGLRNNVDAAREAYEAVRALGPRTRETTPGEATPAEPAQPAPRPAIVPLVDHHVSAPTGLQTGAWRTLAPHYVTRPAPCNAFCPAGNDVVGFVQALARDDLDQAASRLGRTTAFASVCGRVCPAPCMEGCNRAELDGSVDIRALERFVGDHAVPVTPERATPKESRRVAIVGGGPAGLAAAHTLALAGHEATIFEGEEALGGVLRTGIPSYRLPREVLDRELQRVLALGVKARCGERLAAETLRTLSHDFDALILATGLARLRALDVPGHDLPGVEQGIRYLHRVNLERGGELSGHVVVLGGGNTAMDCARSALRSGASKVTVVYRRTRLEMPAIAEEIAEAEDEGVELLFLRQPVAFYGQDRVHEVSLAWVELGEPGQDGRRRPLVTDKSTRLACDAVLLALGQSADLSLLPSGWQLLDGRVIAGGAPQNVFAAGDLSTGEGTVTHALGDGRRAAGRALQFLGEEDEVFLRPDRAEAVGAAEIRLDHFARVAPAQRRHQPAASRIQNFDEVNLALEGSAEAERCFSCGHCNQCDTCLVYCPEGIIARQRPSAASMGACRTLNCGRLSAQGTPPAAVPAPRNTTGIPRRVDATFDAPLTEIHPTSMPDRLLGESSNYAVDLAYCKGCGICVTECPRSGMEMVPT